MKLFCSALTLGTALSIAGVAHADTFKKTQELEVQYVSLDSTYYAYVEAEHVARKAQVSRVKQSPDAQLHAQFGPYLAPTIYNTVVFRLFPDGSATAEIIDPNNHTQWLSISGTYDRQGRNLTIDLNDAGLEIYTDFVGKASKDSKKCYQGTSESPQADFPGSLWVTYWEGCRTTVR